MLYSKQVLSDWRLLQISTSAPPIDRVGMAEHVTTSLTVDTDVSALSATPDRTVNSRPGSVPLRRNRHVTTAEVASNNAKRSADLYAVV